MVRGNAVDRPVRVCRLGGRQSWARRVVSAGDGARRLEAMVRQWNRDPAGPEHQVRAALDYVQQNVRYLGVELGAGILPAPRARRCVRDAVRRLQGPGVPPDHPAAADGLRASPVLVNTSLRSLVGDLLPSPTCFNHVIVAVMLNGRRYSSIRRRPTSGAGHPAIRP